MGMGILLATVWVNLAQTSSKIVSNLIVDATNLDDIQRKLN